MVVIVRPTAVLPMVKLAVPTLPTFTMLFCAFVRVNMFPVEAVIELLYEPNTFIDVTLLPATVLEPALLPDFDGLPPDCTFRFVVTAFAVMLFLWLLYTWSDAAALFTTVSPRA